MLVAIRTCGLLGMLLLSAGGPVCAQLLPIVPPPVAPLLRALLDTAQAGSARAADARRQLQAGPEVRAFYGPAAAPAWTTPTLNLTSEAREALRLLRRTPEYGLPDDYTSPRLLRLLDSLSQRTTPDQRHRQLARLDLLLSDAMLHLLRDLHQGRLHAHLAPARDREPGPMWQPAEALRRALARHAVAEAVLAAQPATREYRQLQQALVRWLARPVPPDSVAGHRARYELLALNLERWRWEAWAPVEEYVLINLPAYELQVVAHDSVLRRHRVIIGKPQSPTPTLSSTIEYFTLAPDWRVPRSIATREMLPRLRADASYLALNNLSLYDEQGRWVDPDRVNWAAVTPGRFPYQLRQSAGCDNALGNVVFRFANPYSVYLHDTPMRQFFDQPTRAFSHGCIRLDEPLELAAWLLRRDGILVRLPSPDECARQPQPRDVRLRRPLPLFVRYATCTAENGQLRCFPDVYGRDEVIRRALFGPRP